MLDVEVQAYNALPSSKRDRFEFLLNMRNALARCSAELICWGVGLDENSTIDRQLVLLEDALTNMVSDVQLVATLTAEWAALDATSIHATGAAIEWCSVCKQGGYGLDDLVGTLSGVLN